MTSKSHDCLDGALAAEWLSEDEKLHLRQLQEVVDETLAPIREEPCPNLVTTVMKKVRETDPHESAFRSMTRRPLTTLAKAARWMWVPRPVAMRPGVVLAGFALIAAGIGLSPIRIESPRGADLGFFSGGVTGTVLYVRFELEAPGVSSVSLAGTFTDWEARHELSETMPGRWTALVPLRPGVYDYSFVIDGERWVADPHAPQVSDGFGGVNSRIALILPEGSGNPSAS